MSSYATCLAQCERFASEHDLELYIGGAVYHRTCVALLWDGEPLEFDDLRMREPGPVFGHHKLDCIAVLINEHNTRRQAIVQLYQWITHIERQGKVHVVEEERTFRPVLRFKGDE